MFAAQGADLCWLYSFPILSHCSNRLSAAGCKSSLQLKKLKSHQCCWSLNCLWMCNVACSFLIAKEGYRNQRKRAIHRASRYQISIKSSVKVSNSLFLNKSKGSLCLNGLIQIIQWEFTFFLQWLTQCHPGSWKSYILHFFLCRFLCIWPKYKQKYGLVLSFKMTNFKPKT